MGIPLSASKLELAAHCLWPFHPPVDVPEEGERSDEARLGCAVDEVLSALCVGESASVDAAAGRYDVYAGDVSALVESELALIAGLGRTNAVTQVAFAYDPETGAARQLGCRLGRDYSGTMPREMVGTADIVWTRGDGLLTVTDWKTGHAHHVPAIDENKQLRFLGMCAARSVGVSEVAIEVHRIRPNGVHDDGMELDALDLAAIEAELTELHEKRTHRTRPKPGTHCVDLWCPALSICEAAQAEAAQLVPVDRLTQGIEKDPRRAVEAFKIAGKLYERFGEQLKAHADRVGGIDMGDGKEWSGRDVAIEAHWRAACTQRRFQIRKRVSP